MMKQPSAILRLPAITVILGSLAPISWPAAAGATDVIAVIKGTRGAPVADAVVFVPETPGVKGSPPPEPYILDQVNKEFVPHVLPIVVGGLVRFPNRDNIHHHVYSFSQAKKFELQLYKGEPTEPVLFDSIGVVKVGCNIHDWMSAIILVLPNAHFARTDAKGEAQLRELPDVPGLKLQVFHERLRGSSDDTARALDADAGSPAPMSWQLNLKPERRKERSAFGY
jgi:hypothetical protein